MKKYRFLKLSMVYIFIMNLMTTVNAGGKEEKTLGKEEKKKVEATSSLFIKYNPPRLGKPGNRVGGGTRGTGGDTVIVSALVPDHTGLTSRPQPVLCWYMDRPVNTRIEITLNDEKFIRPVFEKILNMPDRRGIQCLKLSEHNISLHPGMEYQWFIAVVPDPEQRSKDIISGGVIMYKAPSETLTDRLLKTESHEMPVLYAEEGFWYDALWSIMELMTTNPEDGKLREMRTQLLNQGGLSEAAKYGIK